ncbi:hypothetical protein P7C70_g8623, partial [Phenoliferia sp. Uapishka_3]
MGQAVSAIKASTNHLNETFVMRMKMVEYLSGKWLVSKNYVQPASSVPLDDAPIPLRLATWNIWFEAAMDPVPRWIALFNALLAPSPAPIDIICLQEVTSKSFELLLSVKAVQDDFLVVDFSDVAQRTLCWYGTTILVRKRWMAQNGLDHVEACLTRYESNMGRSLLAVELSNSDGITVRLPLQLESTASQDYSWSSLLQLRIGTSHFESGPEDTQIRRRQFLTAARLLAYPSTYSTLEEPPTSFPRSIDDLTPSFSLPSSVPSSILCGDTNIYSADEVDVLKDKPWGYFDVAEKVGLMGDTFGTTYPCEAGRKRIDLVLVSEGIFYRYYQQPFRLARPDRATVFYISSRQSSLDLTNLSISMESTIGFAALRALLAHIPDPIQSGNKPSQYPRRSTGWRPPKSIRRRQCLPSFPLAPPH